jgi:hypothetical protein
MFQTSSRYSALETVQLTLPDGRVVAYKRRRFCPRGEGIPLLVEAKVTEGDRLDLITHRTLGDPEQFWRVADANNAMDPLGLMTPVGRTIRIPVPQV